MLHSRFRKGLLLLLGALAGPVVADDDDKTSTPTPVTSVTPCVATSTNGNFYYDLRPDIAVATTEGSKARKGLPTEDYTARGWDYGRNFTLNFCDAVVRPVEDVVGVDKANWRNVSAYYKEFGRTYSLGFCRQQSPILITRGRRLVLQYSGGSPCGRIPEQDMPRGGNDAPDVVKYKRSGDEASKVPAVSSRSDDDDKPRRKSTIISFLCDRDPAGAPTMASFIGTDPDECAYFFEVRSQHACASAEPHKPGSVGPGGVFAIILFIAVLVYVVGGIFYQRTVAHARGWRQLPNYSVWAGIWNFFQDMLVIITSSCARLLPNWSGYQSLAASPSRNRDREDENRLIDQLDEEWDD